jgi:ABC-type glycerol-3-phosphate transport system permease component
MSVASVDEKRAVRPAPRRVRRRDGRRRGIAYAVLLVLAAFALIPFAWVFLAAFDSDATIFAKWPQSWTLQNFRNVFSQAGGARLLVNSLVYAGGATILLVVVTTMAGYVLSRFDFPGRRTLMLGVLLTRVVPPTATIAPLYVLAIKLHLIDSYVGMILILAAMEIPLGLWIMKGFFDTVPIELEEAAWMDGATRLRTAFDIVLPLAGPGVAAAALIGFIGAWGDFLIPLVLISDEDKLPISVGLFRAWVSYTHVDWGLLGALSVVYMIPAVIFYTVARRALQRGLSGGLAGT